MSAQLKYKNNFEYKKAPFFSHENVTPLSQSELSVLHYLIKIG